MSSRLHNKWHRHNHHTIVSTDPNLPDSGHDPIASPDSPFQGDFVMNGTLSAISSLAGHFNGESVGVIIESDNIGLSANRNAVINGVLQTDEVSFKTLRSRDFVFEPVNRVVTNSGNFLPITVENRSFLIPLWQIL